MKKMLAVLALVVTAIFVGCGSQVVEFPEQAATTEDSGTPNEQCVDSNCPVGQVCQNNVCTPVDPCAGVTCPEGDVCKDGACVPTDPCAGVTCPEGVQCVDGACPQPQPDSGTPDSGQPDAGEPDSGTPDAGQPDSGPPPDPCDGVCCPHNKVCKQGRCVPKDPCAGVQCPESRVCKAGQCVCDGDEGDRCGRGKTLICHKDCKGKRHNICVSDNAVPAHKRHGDKVGDCSVCR